MFNSIIVLDSWTEIEFLGFQVSCPVHPVSDHRARIPEQQASGLYNVIALGSLTPTDHKSDT